MSFITLCRKWYLLSILPFLLINSVFAEEIELIVKEPYVDVHTGPSSRHPIFHVVTRHEKITIILQKTQWIKIKTIDNKIGWVNQNDIKKTVYSNGESIEFNEASFDEYLKRRFEIGVQSGSLENSPSFSLTAGYLFNELFSTQVSIGKSIGKLSTISIISADTIMTPFPKLAYSPYFVLGVGQSKLSPHTTLINPKTTNSSVAKVAIGLRKYLGERFVVRLELANYILFSADIDADSNDEVTEWKVGFSTFF